MATINEIKYFALGRKESIEELSAAESQKDYTGPKNNALLRPARDFTYPTLRIKRKSIETLSRTLKLKKVFYFKDIVLTRNYHLNMNQ